MARSVHVSNKDYLPSLIDAANQTLHRSPEVDTVVGSRWGVTYRCDTTVTGLQIALISRNDFVDTVTANYFNHCAGVVRAEQGNAANTHFGGNCVAGDKDVGGN